MTDRNYSMKWNVRAGQFIARYRTLYGEAAPWGTKRIPKKQFGRHQELEADLWVLGWYADYARTGLNAPVQKVIPIKKTLRLLGPRWLKYRYDDRGTKPNTYDGLKQSLNNWILDNPKFGHTRIEDLDMEGEFSAEICLAWINSIAGANRTVISHAGTLRTLFEDCIGLEWLDPNTVNPMDRLHVRKLLKNLGEKARSKREVVHLDWAQMLALLTVPTSKIPDYRRVRYFLAYSTGLRDHEVQGLMVIDLHLDEPVPFVAVERQLIKPGPRPFVHLDQLTARGVTKDELAGIETAVVDNPKRDSKRQIPLTPLAVELLRWWIRSGWQQHVGRPPADQAPLFPSGKANRHSHPGQFCFCESAELIRKDLGRVGQAETRDGANIDFKAVRATFATLLNENGVDEREVGELLGHGAKSVAREHYMAETLKRRRANLGKLPFPAFVQLKGTQISVARQNADVLPLRGVRRSGGAGGRKMLKSR